MVDKTISPQYSSCSGAFNHIPLPSLADWILVVQISIFSEHFKNLNLHAPSVDEDCDMIVISSYEIDYYYIKWLFLDAL